MRLTRPTPSAPHWASVQPQREFEERLAWHRRQPPPRKWPSGLVKLFVSIQLESARDVVAFNRRVDLLRLRAETTGGVA